MSDDLLSKREQIEAQLFEAMEAARHGYRTGTCTREDYGKALKEFSAFA